MPGRYFRPIPRSLQMPSEIAGHFTPRTYQSVVNSTTQKIVSWLNMLRNSVDEQGNLNSEFMNDPRFAPAKTEILKQFYPYFYGAGKPREVLTNLEPDVNVPYAPGLGRKYLDVEGRISTTPRERSLDWFMERYKGPEPEHVFPARANILYFNNIYRHLAGQLDKLAPGWGDYFNGVREANKLQDYRMQSRGLSKSDTLPDDIFQEYVGMFPKIPGSVRDFIHSTDTSLPNSLSIMKDKLTSDTNPIAIRRAAVQPVIEWYKLRQQLGIGE